MKTTRNRSAWIWLAVAVMAMSTVLHADSAAARTNAYAHPVFEFFSGHPSSGTLSTHRGSRFLRNWSTREWSAQQSSHAGLSQTMLPVFFIGLVAPLSLFRSRTLAASLRAAASPALPSLFQRPPPALYA